MKFSGATTETRQMRTRELLQAISPFWKPYRSRILTGLFFLMLAASLSMVQPWVIKLAIDDLETGKFQERISTYIWIILGITVLVCVCRYAMRILLIGASRYFEHDLRRHVFQHIQKLPRSFFDEVPTGDIMSRLTNDVLRVRMILGPALMQIGNTAVSLVLALILMFSIDVKLTLLALIPLPLMPLMFYFMGRRIRYHSEKVQEQMASITSCAQENLTGIRVIKAYNLEKIESEKFRKLSSNYVRKNLDLIRFQGLFMPLVVLLSGLSTTCILFFCGWWVIQGRITLGSLVAFIEYLGILSWPLFAIGWVVGLFQQGSSAMLRIQKILEVVPRDGMLPVECSVVPSDLVGDIEFRNVSFSFPNSEVKVLDNLNFKVKNGETVAVMGASGAGKSTILELLTKSYEPISGEILCNGHNLADLPEYIVREVMGVMPQVPVLFSRSIQENLKFGLRPGSRIELDEANRIACVQGDIIGFPEGIDTVLGERGVNLSGGQKQRLTLSRAILRDTPVLLMDDPFASVDISTEENILSNLPEVSRSRTTIIVSHRVNTAKRTDRILIVENGKITEEGSHEELVNADGYYSRLCRKQALMAELESI